MQKDFDIWNQQKKNLELKAAPALVFHEREIWWCTLGLILKKFNNRVALILPMTSKNKFGKFYVSLFYGNKTSTVILSQIRLISVKRLRRFLRVITPHQFSLIKEKFIELIK